MRIDSKPPVPRVSLEPRAASETATPSAAPSSASVVKLSAAGLSIGEARPPTTTQRLERIRELLDQGEYPVDLDALAARIVDDDAVRGAPKG